MKTYWLGLFSAIVTLPLAVAAFFRLGLGDIQADAPPPAWENRIMTAAVHRSVDKRAGDLPAASAADEDSLVRGGKLYMLGCHGELGKPVKEISQPTREFRIARQRHAILAAANLLGRETRNPYDGNVGLRTFLL